MKLTFYTEFVTDQFSKNTSLNGNIHLNYCWQAKEQCYGSNTPFHTLARTLTSTILTLMSLMMHTLKRNTTLFFEHF